MFRPLGIVATAAILAGLATLASLSTGFVDAGPLPQRDEADLKTCSHRPWPYLDCVGTRFNTRVRLVTTDRLH
jgi:hypothetical protein